MSLHVTIDGSPYAFASDSTTSVTSADSDWPTAAIVLANTLDWQGSSIRWTERMRPLDGTLDVSPISFGFFDPLVSAGPAAGHNVFTWMFTRDTTQIPSTILQANCTATDTSLTMLDTSVFGAAPFTVWCEQEAMLCTAVTDGTHLAVTRGYLGSRAVAHSVNTDLGQYPEVWGQFAWLQSKRVILWQTNSAGVATAIWRGYCQRSPREKEGEDKVKYELQCGHIYEQERQLPLGNASATCRVRGYNARGIVFNVSVPETPAAHISVSQTRWPLGDADYIRVGISDYSFVYDDLQTACNTSLEATRSWLTETSGGHNVNVADYVILQALQVDVRGDTVSLHVQFNWGDDETRSPHGSLGTGINIGCHGLLFGEGGKSASESVTDPIDPRNGMVQLNGAPMCVVACPVPSSLPASQSIIPVDDISAFTNAWGSTTYSDPPGAPTPIYQTSITPMLLADYNDDIYFTLSPVAQSADDSNIKSGGPTFSGWMTPRPKSARAHQAQALYGLINDGTGSVFYLTEPVQLRYTIEVQSTHWIYALKYAMADATFVQSGSDPRNWDFSQGVIDSVTYATDSLLAARDLYLDGTQTIGQLVGDMSAVHGCCVGIRNSKLAIIPFRRPLANEVVSSTITANDFPRGLYPKWTVLEDGIANIASVTADAIKVVVREARSCGRYGATRSIDLRLAGLPFQTANVTNPRDLGQLALTRFLYLWNVPAEEGSIPVTIDKLQSINHGDFIAISEYSMPDRKGGRGWASRIAMVIGREPDFSTSGDAVMWLTVLALPFAYGISPCARVASVSGSTVTLATNYINGNSDYAGNADAVGGATFFTAGDRVQLLTRNDTNYPKDSLVIQSIASNVITFTAPVPTVPNNWAGIIAANGIVDLRYDRYTTSGLQANQKKYAWCGKQQGGSALGVIDGTGDLAQEWAP